ncbi:MAG TPA: ABC transporter ATP-binding protein [bacterium]|nr:ABC transporter ATP-binding protein [bacterium]
MRRLARFGRYLVKYWDKELVLLVCAGLSSLFGLIGPLIPMAMINYAYDRHDLFVFNMLILAGFFTFVFNGVTGAVRGYTATYVRNMLDFDLRAHYYKHLFSLSQRFFQRRTTGEQMFRLGPDIGGTVSFVVDSIPSALTQITTTIGVLVLTFWLDWKLCVLAIVAVPPFYIHSYFFGKKQQQITKAVREKEQEIHSGMAEAFSHAKVIKAFSRERFEVRRYLSLWISNIRLRLVSYKIGVISGSSLSVMDTVITTGLTYYAGYQVIAGQMSLGAMVAIMLYVFKLMGVLKSFGDIYRDILVKQVSMDRVLETLEAEPEVADRPEAIDVGRIRGDIELVDVSFGYEACQRVLQNVSLSLKNGQSLGIVGESGAGKSTIVGLILRLFDPESGEVRMDGRDIRTLKRASFIDKVGVVLQEPWLFNTTVRENIAFGRPNASEEEIIEAAELAGANEFICELPKGFETQIAEHGARLSEGQKQRIAIARALVRRPAILILDEATSNLNVSLQRRILMNIRTWARTPTLIVVSHRVTAIQDADNIIVLKGGRIVEQGKHAELIQTTGYYLELCAGQADQLAGSTVRKSEI